ncbi:heavy metal-responsive transcriptional regulator [Gemmatimonas sp.]|uniref:heavy metal-responsive transcriptional regulator n=1 Tax=Gemmatimonas sp. TaxID=1962908 RepID=UPI003983629F
MPRSHASLLRTQLKPPPGAPAVDAGSDSQALRIGDLAALAGVSADTLRYYERRGLLQPASRRASGYREFPPEAARLVRFIKHAQALGFSLAEVEELIRLRASGQPGPGLEARHVAVAKIRDIDERVRQLGALRTALAGLVAQCDQTCGADGGSVQLMDCPILAALDDDTRDIEPLPSAARGGSQTARPTLSRGPHDHE